MICTSRKYSDEIPCILVKTFVGKICSEVPFYLSSFFRYLPLEWQVIRIFSHTWERSPPSFPHAHSSPTMEGLSRFGLTPFLTILQNISWSQVQPHLLSVLSPLLATLLAQAGSHPTITLPCSEALLRLNNAPTFHKISHSPPSGTSLLLS